MKPRFNSIISVLDFILNNLILLLGPFFSVGVCGNKQNIFLGYLNYLLKLLSMSVPLKMVLVDFKHKTLDVFNMRTTPLL